MIRAVPLALGGKDWQLRCTLGAMAAVEVYGQRWQEVLDQLRGERPSFQATQRVIWALLQDNPEPPSMADVGSWVEPQNLPTVLMAVSECLRAAFPTNGGPPADPPRGRGTGATSSRSPTAHSDSSPTPSGV